MEARLFSTVRGGGMRDNHHKLKREKYRLTKRNFHSKDSQAVVQVVRLWSLCLGHLQDPNGKSPEQSGLTTDSV